MVGSTKSSAAQRASTEEVGIVVEVDKHERRVRNEGMRLRELVPYLKGLVHVSRFHVVGRSTMNKDLRDLRDLPESLPVGRDWLHVKSRV